MGSPERKKMLKALRPKLAKADKLREELNDALEEVVSVIEDIKADVEGDEQDMSEARAEKLHEKWDALIDHDEAPDTDDVENWLGEINDAANDLA